VYVFKKIVIATTLLASPVLLSAQAAPTASRAGDLQIGGGFSNANTDYLPQRVNGGTAYFDFDFYRHLGVEGEFRFLKDGGTNIYEKTYEIGGRYSRVYKDRYQPYGKLMYGRGVFNFATDGQTTANLAYNMIAAGGGMDYRALPHLNIRAEFEYQRWLGFPPNGLSPTVVTIGAAYRFGSGRRSR
jgi:opacity protein-like surface antigen